MSNVSKISILDTLVTPAPRYLMRLSLIEQLLAQLPRDIQSFLEIGPGMGDLSLYLEQRFPEASGLLLDFSNDCIDVLRHRTENNSRLRLITGDFMTMSHEGRHDLIVACEVFEHVADDLKAFQIVSDLLCPNGYFIFSAPAFRRKWQHADEYAGHYRRYERAELIEKFSTNGFRIDVMWCYGFPITQILYPLWQLYYGHSLQKQGLSKEDATKRSGIKRPLAGRTRAKVLAHLLRPFYFLQNQVKNTDLGDGFLILAQKVRPA
ncbi:MAG: class I SAM-dependent methyltransferase [Sulfuricaulis sp.]